jgi:hypothetical protein
MEVAKLEEAGRARKFTVVVLLDEGSVLDLDEGKKERWRIKELLLPLDVQFLPGEHVLIAEHDGGRVTERSRKGDVLWEHRIDMPIVAQRLPDGNTFIGTRSQLVELNRDKKEPVFTYSPPGGELIMRAQKLRNGDIALIQTPAGAANTRYVRLDPKGRELKSFPVNVKTSGGRIDVLPNGHVLVPENSTNRVVEMDGDGKEVWKVDIDRPIMAQRLPNGNTLVTSMNPEIGAVELDHTGKQVWQYKSETRVTRAYRH